MPSSGWLEGISKRSARVSDPAAAMTAGLQNAGETFGRPLWLGQETGHSEVLKCPLGLVAKLPSVLQEFLSEDRRDVFVVLAGNSTGGNPVCVVEIWIC